MPGTVRSLLRIGLLAGSLPLALAAPGAKPTPPPTPTTCTTCEIVYMKADTAKNSGGRVDLMLVHQDGTSKTLLLSGGRGVKHEMPEWAPDGEWIAFYTFDSSGRRVQVIKYDGTGLTTVATPCTTSASDVVAWRPVPVANGYWLVYQDARRADGSCILETSPIRANLWAADVSLGSPVLVSSRVCLTCSLNTDDTDFWPSPSWSRDGYHLTARRNPRRTGAGHFLFDVSFDSGSPVLGPPLPFAPPELDSISGVVWGHWSDSIVFRTVSVNAKNDIVEYTVDLASEQLGTKTNITAGSPYYFARPVWSACDTALVSDVGSTGSATTDGVYVIIPSPFSMKLIVQKGGSFAFPSWKPQQSCP